MRPTRGAGIYSLRYSIAPPGRISWLRLTGGLHHRLISVGLSRPKTEGPSYFKNPRRLDGHAIRISPISKRNQAFLGDAEADVFSRRDGGIGPELERFARGGFD